METGTLFCVIVQKKIFNFALSRDLRVEEEKMTQRLNTMTCNPISGQRTTSQINLKFFKQCETHLQWYKAQ